MIAIRLEDLEAAGSTFRALEKRARFYDMALGLLEAGYEIEGCILLLATWNTGRFRFVGSNFDVDALEKALADLDDDFAALSDFNIQSVDLAQHGSRIERMFDRLASIPGVEYTGASKLMSLKCPKLFVMWDDYIRGGKPKKHYSGLACITSGKWCFREYDKSGKGYVAFLQDVRNRFRDFHYPEEVKTLAKAIDEFNYVHVTVPMQLVEDRVKQAKRAVAK